MKCPECRAEHRIPYQGIQQWPSNVTLQRFLELHIEITGELPDPTSGQVRNMFVDTAWHIDRYTDIQIYLNFFLLLGESSKTCRFQEFRLFSNYLYSTQLFKNDERYAECLDCPPSNSIKGGVTLSCVIVGALLWFTPIVLIVRWTKLKHAINKRRWRSVAECVQRRTTAHRAAIATRKCVLTARKVTWRSCVVRSLGSTTKYAVLCLDSTTPSPSSKRTRSSCSRTVPALLKRYSNTLFLLRKIARLSIIPQ